MLTDPLTGKNVVILGLARLTIGIEALLLILLWMLTSCNSENVSPAVATSTSTLTTAQQNMTQIFARSTGTSAYVRTERANVWATATAEAPMKAATQTFYATNDEFARMTAQALPDSIGDILPLKWPVPPITDYQLQDVRKCRIEQLAKERYPQTVNIDALPESFAPWTGCDWATLAFAYLERTPPDAPLPERGKQAYAFAFYVNPAYAFHYSLERYFDSVSIVEAPPMADIPIAHVRINYDLAVLGPCQQNWEIEISSANTNPLVSGYLRESCSDTGDTTAQISQSLDRAVVQGLGPALTDLLPIDSQFSVIGCTDFYPNWQVVLTFEDETQLTLKNNGSNIMLVGAPFQTTIEGQHYVQHSHSFLAAVGKMLDTIEAVPDSYFQPTTECIGGGALSQAFPSR